MCTVLTGNLAYTEHDVTPLKHINLCVLCVSDSITYYITELYETRYILDREMHSYYSQSYSYYPLMPALPFLLQCHVKAFPCYPWNPIPYCFHILLAIIVLID